MQFSQYCILALFLAIVSNVIEAKKPTCQLVIKDAELRPSNTHIRIRGDIDVGHGDCKPTNDKSHDVTSIVSFSTHSNRVVSFTDSKKVKHSGSTCKITASWFNKPRRFGKTGSTEVFVPIRFIDKVVCNHDTSKTHHTTKHRKTTHRTRRHRTTRRRTTRKRKTTKKVSSSSHHDGYSQHFSGTATFFTPDQGACGDWNDDSDLIAAIGGSLYGSYSRESSYCGKKVKVVNKKNKKSVVVTIKDACESCQKSHIDLSPGAFAKIGAFVTGILDVDWYILD